MFLELMTVWKAKDDNTVNGRQSQNMAKSTLHPPHGINDDMIGSWNLRRTGILFSKQEQMWIFLVFIEPGDEGLVFSHRIVDLEDVDEPNSTHESGVPAFCGEREDDIRNLMNYIASNIESKGPIFLEHIAEDILWGWGEFLKQMRLKILQVC